MLTDNCSQIIEKNSLLITQEEEWRDSVNYANKRDYRLLANALITSLEDTEMHNQALAITTDWLNGLKHKRNAKELQRIIDAYFKKNFPRYALISSVSKSTKSFISELFAHSATDYVLITDNIDDIVIITETPTSEIIYEYGKLYMKLLAESDEYFDFMVHGKGEISESDYTMLTKDEWNAYRQ